MSTPPATPSTGSSGSSSGGIAQLEALQQKMIKEMTRLEGDEVKFQGQTAPLQTGKNDARNVTGS
jgi:hypothetical protein